jgi:hypothetical protein
MQSCKGRQLEMQNCKAPVSFQFPSPHLPLSPSPWPDSFSLSPSPFPLSPFPFPQQFKKSISPNLERSWRDEGKNWFPVPKLCFFCLMVVIRDKNYLGILWIWVYLLGILLLHDLLLGIFSEEKWCCTALYSPMLCFILHSCLLWCCRFCNFA